MKFCATLAAVGAATAAANPLHNTPLSIPTITIAPTFGDAHARPRHAQDWMAV
jgi:hypothetical protein